jgi:DNA mismatch repair protein MutS
MGTSTDDTAEQLSLDVLFVESPSMPIPANDLKCDSQSSVGEKAGPTTFADEAVSPRVLAPMLQQYQELKKKYVDYLLLFQVGDFFEVFFDDARLVSDVLNIRLTSRDKNATDPIPMCGVPIHAIESYLPKLIEAGYRVVFYSQVEESSPNKKGMVRREVSRIVTPGVRLEGEGLDQKQTNYLAALIFHAGVGGLGYVDVSTGHLRLREFETIDELTEAVEQIAPAELILPLTIFGRPVDKSSSWIREIKAVASRLGTELLYRPFDKVAHSIMQSRLQNRLSEPGTVRLLDDVAPENLTTLEALLSYVDEVSFGRPPQLSTFGREIADTTLVLDGSTRRNLELLETRLHGERKHSLLGHIDKTRSAMGGRLLREWVLQPSRSLATITARHDAVSSLVERQSTLQGIRFLLLSVRDLDRIVSRITALRATPRDLSALAESLSILPKIRSALSELDGELLRHLLDECDPLDDVRALLVEALVAEPPTKLNDGGVFRDGFDQGLDELRALERDGAKLLSALEAREREDSGISSLKIRYTNVFGYFIEVSRSNASKVPPRFERRQTLANAERYVTAELKELEGKLLSSRSRQIELEKELFIELRRKITEQSARIHKVARVLAMVDVLGSFADCASENNYARPSMVAEGALRIQRGRHPVVERVIGEQNFVPNDTSLDPESRRFAILTGPNMGGKSTYLRQVALIQILAQAGSFVPADQAELPIVDRIFTRIGASDDLSRGDSTFMVEMREASTILRKATARSLVLIDEIGRGTATADGLALALAISEWLHSETRCKTIFATHFHQLTELPERQPGMFSLSVGILERSGEIEFTHRIEECPAARSYGIEVARLAGLPSRLLARAEEILSAEESVAGALPSPTRAAPPRIEHRSPELERRDAMLEQLEALDCNSLTPLDALVYLTRIQSRLRDMK